MKLSTIHRKRKIKGIGKKVKEKIPRDLGPADSTIHTREDGPTLQLCGWRLCYVQMDQWALFSGAEVQEENWPKTKDPTLMVEKKVCLSDLED